MRIAIVGQKDFGKAALEAFIKRGDTVAGVFCAPEKPGEAPDALRVAAEQAGVAVFALPSLRVEEARHALKSLNVDVAVLAYVLQFVPQDFATIPRHGTIQFHPSLLPRYRGPSSINWPIILGDTETGLSIFRPVDGLDEGPVILQKKTPIGPDETVGQVYFGRLFPMGLAALIEAAELVASGKAALTVQDESAASYEGWCRDPEAQINWHTHVDLTYNLIRGCDPAPGAWTWFNQKRLQLYDARKHITCTFSQVKGKIGAITAIGETSMTIAAQGGQIEVFKLRLDGGKKLPAAQFCAESGVCLGTILGVTS
jgi:methionyl-tRNA formyltransferase